MVGVGASPRRLLLVLAALLRLPHLGAIPLSIDEAITADMVRSAREGGDLAGALARDLDAPLLPVLCVGLGRLFGVARWHPGTHLASPCTASAAASTGRRGRATRR
jgi:hypothetical protein